MDLQTLSLFHEKLIFKGLCIESFLFLAASPFLVILLCGQKTSLVVVVVV